MKIVGIGPAPVSIPFTEFLWLDLESKHRHIGAGCLVTHPASLEGSSGPERSTRVRDAAQKLRMMFEAILEPIVLGCKPDQDAQPVAVPRDHDFLIHRQSEVFRPKTD